MRKGQKHTNEAKQKISDSHKGYKFSDEAKKKMSDSHKGQIPWCKGKKLSNEHKKKLSLAKIGKTSSFKGKKHTEESKKKNSNSRKGQCIGKDNPNWNGGSSFLPYSVDWTQTLKRSIRERDKYTCQLCGKKQTEKTFCVHHIDYDKKNCNPNNLITLCRSCHNKTNSKHDYWIDYFTN